MATAGSIIIDMLLKTGSFVTDAQRSQKELQKLKKEAYAAGEALGNSIRNIAAAAGIGLSIAGLTDMVKSAIDAADHLNDLSKQTGITVETLGGIGFAAKQAGGDLDSAASAIGKLNKTIAAAAAGNKEAIDFFKALGVEILDASGNTRKADAVFADIADRFQDFEDGPEKAALALRGFGKAGADIIPLLNDGGDALKQNIAYYKQFSGVTQEVAENADKFNDTLEKIKLLSGAASTTLASELLPTMQLIADEFVRFKESGDFKSVAEGLNSLFKIIISAGADVGFVLLGIGREIGAVAAQLGALANFDLTAFNSISEAVKEDGARARKELDAFKARLNSTVAKPTGTDASSFAVLDQVAAPKKQAPRLADSGAAGDQQAELKKRLDGQIKAIQQFATDQRDAFAFANKYLDGVYADGLLSLDQFFGDQKKLRDANLAAEIASFDKQIDALKTYRAQVAKGADRIDADNKIIELQGKRAEAVKKSAQDEILAEQQRQAAVKATQDQYQSFIATLESLKGNDAGAAAINIGKQVREAADLVTKAGGDPALVEQYRAQLTGIQALTQAQKDYGKVLDEQSKREQNIALDAANAGASEFETLAALRDSRQAAITQLGDMAKQARDLADALNTDAARKFADDMSLAFKQAQANIDPLAQRVNSLFQDQFANAFTGFIEGSKSAKDAFKDFANGVLAEMANIAAKNLAASLFGQNNGQSSIGGLLSGLFGGTSSSGGANNYIGSTANDSSLYTLPGRATGGHVSAGKAYMVGERGPEPFIPNTAGKILPASALGQRGNTIIENHGARVQEKKQPNGDIRYVIDAVRNEIAAGLASGTGVEAQALRSRGVSLDRSLTRRA